MNQDSAQSISRSLKVLIGIIIAPSILLSLVLIGVGILVYKESTRNVTVVHKSDSPLPIRNVGKPIPEKYSNINELSLQLESIANKGKSRIINLRLINPTDKPIVYVARIGSNPYHILKVMEDGKWEGEEISWFFCGTHARESVVVNPDESTFISVEVDSDLFPVKIGLNCAYGWRTDYKLWTKAIERDQTIQYLLSNQDKDPTEYGD